ncbi:DMT family transporter [Clostridium sardiniense]|uniref:DMT family transporter n=1 Tax=Clostridium sardiniense TaxID=29369 RepID=A0ABS7L1U8_CLOSR|nr:DMT family transporter [Clostridium sardiniense]MBM7836574.1 transporter family-2 protein [Clostridium sardiniense]MBY0757051.1 DMT family transporter [Clostridium sardiniense]MDQ0462072.1 transporter family-2 protein [Clostridium sardiniense]
MLGFIYAIISGISMSLQGVFNTRLGEKIGTWETNTLVQLTGLIITLIVTVFVGKGDFKALSGANKIYLLGGALGVVIIFTVMMSIGSLGTTCAIGIILVSQLVTAAIIDYFGLFGSEKINFTLKEFIGVAIMIIGIIVFKWKG